MNNNNFPYDDKCKASIGMQIYPYVWYGIYSDDFEEAHKMVSRSTWKYTNIHPKKVKMQKMQIK